ncbi:4250_t:CDS:2, partial [Dentiscutata erythropus]
LNIGQNKIIIFATKTNLQCLSWTPYWIMDDIFKMVSTIFKQIYTIHAPVGTNNNSQVFPLVYALMSGKSEELYTHLFQTLIDFAEDNDFQLESQTIITDFEQAAICASSNKKIQEAKLVTKYGTDLDLSEKLRCLLALAFLPPEEIPATFNIFKKKIPPIAHKVAEWFENTYTLGKNCVSGNHLGAYSIIEEMQKEQQRVDCQVERILNGEQRPTPKKKQLTVRNEL